MEGKKDTSGYNNENEREIRKVLLKNKEEKQKCQSKAKCMTITFKLLKELNKIIKKLE